MTWDPSCDESDSGGLAQDRHLSDGHPLPAFAAPPGGLSIGGTRPDRSGHAAEPYSRVTDVIDSNAALLTVQPARTQPSAIVGRGPQ